MSAQQWREVQDERHRQFQEYRAALRGDDMSKTDGKRDLQAVIEEHEALIQQQQAQIQQQQAQLAAQQHQLDQLFAMLEQPSKKSR